MLCSVCAAFDIKALYQLAKDRVRTLKPRVPGGGGFPEYAGIPNFYRQHSGVKDLRDSATRGCELCSAIWAQYAESLPAALRHGDQPLPVEHDGPVLLGLSNFSLEAQGLPYLIATQQLPREAVRSLAAFDVYSRLGNNSKTCF